MQRPYQHLDYNDQGGVFCVRLKGGNLDEEGLERLNAEMGRLIDEEGCRKMVLSLGPGDLDCLYSVFLAKLINLQRRLESVGGSVVLSEVSSNTQDVFRATGLDRFFKFFADQTSAVQSFG